MTDIPEQTASVQDLAEWDAAKKALNAAKQKEHFLRMRCFNGFFPNPVEGTNKYDLPKHYVLKGVHVINRNIDAAALSALAEQLRDKGIAVETLVKYTPELKKAEYNKLTEEERTFFDQVLIIKPGSPSMEVVLPAKYKKEAEAK